MVDSAATPMLEVRGVSKAFGPTWALRSGDLNVDRGEIHALVGHNGSGKSTLIKILAGLEQPDSVLLSSYRGQPLELGARDAAKARGIRFIHQDLGLIPELTVAENVALGGDYANTAWVSDRREAAAAEELLGTYGLQVDAGRPLGSLSIAEQTMVAIARAVHTSGGQHLLVLDEPTAALPDREVRQLFDLLKAIRDRGGSVLYVTHRLSELFGLADRLTVLRDGTTVAQAHLSDLTHDRLVELMIGQPLGTFYPPTEAPARSDVALRATGIQGGGVKDASFNVHRGEILGVTGLVGSGFDEILPLTFGARTPNAGTVTMSGRSIEPGSPRAAIAAGLVYAPADRRALSAITEWTVRENVTLPRLSSSKYFKWMTARTERVAVRRWTRTTTVKPADPDTQFKALSGGNQQKAVLARWLRCEPAILMMDEPTNGVDTGSKYAIYENLRSLAQTGTGIVMASSDSEELAAVCDRVLVLKSGVVHAQLSGDELTPDRIAAESMRTQGPSLNPLQPLP